MNGDDPGAWIQEPRRAIRRVMTNSDSESFSMKSIHSGEIRTEFESLTAPIFQTASFLFKDTEQLIDLVKAKSIDRFEYARYGNPTQRSLERKIIALEKAEEAHVVASGMAAMTVPMLALLSSGDQLILTEDSYLKSRQFCETDLSRFGIQTIIVKPDADSILAAVTPRTRMVFTESPTNPFFRIVDCEKLARQLRPKNIITIVDATLGSPYNQTLLDSGIDLVIHSLTKYFNGHNDVLGGVIAGRKDLMARVRDFNGRLGSILPPHSCYQILRGIKTMSLRVKQQNESAQKIAEFLDQHEKVKKVHYPGLPSHPDFEMGKKLMKGYGGLVTIDLKGDYNTMRRFCDRCRVFRIGPSFAGPESLIDPPVIMSHWDLSPEDRLALGVTDTLVRLSIGLEDTETLIADLSQALE